MLVERARHLDRKGRQAGMGRASVDIHALYTSGKNERCPMGWARTRIAPAGIRVAALPGSDGGRRGSVPDRSSARKYMAYTYDMGRPARISRARVLSEAVQFS